MSEEGRESRKHGDFLIQVLFDIPYTHYLPFSVIFCLPFFCSPFVVCVNAKRVECQYTHGCVCGGEWGLFCFFVLFF